MKKHLINITVLFIVSQVIAFYMYYLAFGDFEYRIAFRDSATNWLILFEGTYSFIILFEFLQKKLKH